MSRRGRKSTYKCRSGADASPTEQLVLGQTSAPAGDGPAAHSQWIHRGIMAAVAALCSVLYAWTIDFPMVFDDHTYMKDSPLFRDSSSFNYPAHFTRFVRAHLETGTDPDLAVNFVLRPVAYATLHFNYLLDGFHPRWYRVVNIAIHAASSVLIFVLLRLLLRRSPLATGLSPGSHVFIPATVSFLFAAHPLAVESVTYIVQRFTSLAALFSLLTLWLHLSTLEADVGWRRRLLRTATVVSLLLAMQTKEDSFFVPPLAVLIDWLVCGSRLRAAMRSAVPLLACMPVIPALIFMISTAQHGGLDWHQVVNIVNSRDAPLHHWHYIITQLTVVTEYLRHLVWPVGICVDPEWPTFETLANPTVMASLAVLLSLLLASWRLFCRFRGDARAALGFVGVLWFFLTISASSGLVPLPDVMALHRTYMPFIGMMLLATCLLDRLREIQALRHVIPAVVVAATSALSWATIVANDVWKSELSLWEDTVRKSPGKHRVWSNLGVAYSDSGREDKAVDCFEKALQIEPRFHSGALNLSNSLLKLNRPHEALRHTLKLTDSAASSGRPGDEKVLFTHASALAATGNLTEAIHIFTALVAANPRNPDVHFYLGTACLFANDPGRALRHYEEVKRLGRSYADLDKLIDLATSRRRVPQ